MTKEEIIQKGEKKFPPDEKLIIPNDRDEAAKEYAKTTFKKPYSDNPDEEVTIVEPDKYAGFIAGAKWQKEQMPMEWSEEDEDMLNSCISSIEEAKENRYAYKETDGDTSYDHEIAWLKSLRKKFKRRTDR